MKENVFKPDESDPAWWWLALSLFPGIGYKKIRYFILATLLELELTGTVENIGGKIYRLSIELELHLNLYFLWAEWKPTSMLSEKIVVWRSS